MKWSHDFLHRTHDAGRWINSSNTKSNQLLNVLTFFVEEGLPEEHLDTFLDGVMPIVGWHEWHESIPPNQSVVIRKTHEYGPMVHQIVMATAARRKGI